MTLKIYNQYAKYGIDGYYKEFAEEYYNPHADKITDLYNRYLKDDINQVLCCGENILDIACGDGLMKRIILAGVDDVVEAKQITGCDPYFDNKYVDYSYSFEDIAYGLVDLNEDLKFKVGICCYAFHLLERNWYYSFFNGLADIITERFIIITPSKKIIIEHPKWIVEKNIRDSKTKISLIILKRI
jgi:SAM-dependent methyltransferase